MAQAERFGVSFEPELLAEFDRACRAAGYRCRSEALRDLVRAWLAGRRLAQGEGEAVAVLAYVYAHERAEVSRNLTRLGHRFFHEVLTTVHIHLDEHKCLEVLLLRGDARAIQARADRMRALKGVEQGGLVLIGLKKGGKR